VIQLWKIIIVNKSDDDFLDKLPKKPSQEIQQQFDEVIRIFSNLRFSVYCTSAIFPVESYNTTNQKLSIHYHVDNDEEAIRIIKIELE